MKSTTFRRAILPGVAVLAMTLTACGGNNSGSSTPTGSGGGSSVDASLSGTLNGGGSSAQQAAQAAWTQGLQSQASGVTVNYDPVGSGTGRSNFISKAYDFAGTDTALSTDSSAGTSEVDQAKARCGGTAAIEVPVYVSPIAVIFNLSGVKDLNLTPEVIANIFNGTITTWNDKAIASLNPNAKLPSTAITPVHRSDDSGTTANFTDYLSKTSGGAWASAPDDTWPTTKGESADGTSGLVSAVKGGNGTIGYADDSQAGGLSVAAIKVGSSYTKPSADGAAKVLAESPVDSGRDANDLAIDIDRKATDGYPLILSSYEIACQTYSDASTTKLVKAYLSYMVSDAGQQAAASAAGSAPLASTLAAKAQAIVAKIGS